MKFAEIPMDMEKINTEFAGTPIITYKNEIRADFETTHGALFTDDMNKVSQKLGDLTFYKTELFSSYCLGLLSVMAKDSKFNAVINGLDNRHIN
jgi:hypothetical protein